MDSDSPLTDHGVQKKKVTKRRSKRDRPIQNTTARRGLMRLGRGGRVTPAASEKISDVLSYIAYEIIEASMAIASDAKKATLTPHHLRWAISQDSDMATIFDLDSLVVQGGGFHVSLNEINDREPTPSEKRARAKRQREARAK